MNEIEIKKQTIINIDDAVLKSAEEQAYTYLHCRYVTSPKYYDCWWVNIYLTSYIVNNTTKERLALLDAINIPIVPERYYLKRKGDSLHFTLVFPAIPKNWLAFDFIEQTETGVGLPAKNISSNSSGVYNVRVS